MADYKDIAASIAAEKGIEDFGDLMDIIDGRYFFVYGDQETQRGEPAPTKEGGQAYGEAPRKKKGVDRPAGNIRLSNTRIPSRYADRYSPIYKPEEDKAGDAGEPIETVDREESKEAPKGFSTSLSGFGKRTTSDVGAARDAKPADGDAKGSDPFAGRTNTDGTPLKFDEGGWEALDVASGQAAMPQLKAMRSANADLVKLYDLLDEGYEVDSPEAQELLYNIMEDVNSLATDAGSTGSNLTKGQKAMREQMGP